MQLLNLCSCGLLVSASGGSQQRRGGEEGADAGGAEQTGSLRGQQEVGEGEHGRDQVQVGLQRRHKRKDETLGSVSMADVIHTLSRYGNVEL